jgi:hypothetical protein
MLENLSETTHGTSGGKTHRKKTMGLNVGYSKPDGLSIGYLLIFLSDFFLQVGWLCSRYRYRHGSK